MNRIAQVYLLMTIFVLMQGCNSYRFMPSHGGGKRFDEEERAVSAAIRNSVAQLDIKNLAGHKANIVLVSLAHNGGGSITLPGFNSASVGYNYNSSSYSGPYMIDNQGSYNANLGYTPSASGWPTVFPTDQDLSYLEASIQMRLRVNDIAVTVPDPEYVLYVLVDVLGINRSKQDSFVVWNEVLTASCELTYYIIDTKTNKVAFGAKRTSAEASYRESSIFGMAGYKTERSQYQTSPNLMPTDSNDPVIISYKTIKTLVPQSEHEDEPKFIDPLSQEFQEAQASTNAGNWQAAEALLCNIRTVNPNYPGLAALASQVENEKAKSKLPASAPALTAEPAPTPAPVPTAEPVPAPAPVPTVEPAPTPTSAPTSKLFQPQVDNRNRMNLFQVS